MREFNYIKFWDHSFPISLVNTISKIHEFKGKQELYIQNYPNILEKIVAVAKTQSTKYSNAIEGIYTTEGRLEELMKKKAEPRNRDEEEIAGYRNILDLVHENYKNIKFDKNDILTLHNQLYSYSDVNYKGRFKTMDNAIVETDFLGRERIIFEPVKSFETERALDNMIKAFNEALKARVPILILIPMVIHDFLCIHPFDDGNGRMSRILTLLLLYKSDFFVGRYVSIERLIEESKYYYYSDLQNSQIGWHEGTNDELPFIKYMLRIILQAYEESEIRFKLAGEKKITSADRVYCVLQTSLKPLSKKEINVFCSDLSQRTIERGLKSLQDQGRIKQVGNGRSTKYTRV